MKSDFLITWKFRFKNSSSSPVDIKAPLRKDPIVIHPNQKIYLEAVYDGETVKTPTVEYADKETDFDFPEREILLVFPNDSVCKIGYAIKDVGSDEVSEHEIIGNGVYLG